MIKVPKKGEMTCDACLLLSLMFLLRLPSWGAQADELAAKSQRAKALMAAAKFEEAIPIYTDLVRALPDNPGLILNLGIALHMAGHCRRALREFEAVLKLDPDNVPAHLFLAAAHLRLGEPLSSITPLQKVIQTQPDNREAHEMLAEAYSSSEHYPQAVEQFQKLSELDTQDPKAFYGLGLAYEALARRAFDQLGQLAPGSGYWLALVADSRAKQQQYSSAFYLYRQALAQMPTLRGVHAALAKIYTKSGHPDWATVEEDRERAMGTPDCSEQKLECDFVKRRYQDVVVAARQSQTVESFYWQARAYNELALEAFSHLFGLPPSAERHELMARVFRNEGHHLESAQEWREAFRLSPENRSIQKELAISLNLTGDHQAALELFEALLKSEPSSSELNYLVGDTLLNMRRAEEAIPLLKKGVEGEPRRLPARDALARAYLQIGQAAKAVPHLEAALPIDEDGSLHYQLARAYQREGKRELAGKMLKKYQEIRNALTAAGRATEAQVQITPP